MSRVIKMSRGFLRARARLGLLDADSQKAIASAVGLLAVSQLPDEKDDSFMMPPSVEGHLRKIPWLEVSIGYSFDAEFLYLLTTKSS